MGLVCSIQYVRFIFLVGVPKISPPCNLAELTVWGRSCAVCVGVCFCKKDIATWICNWCVILKKSATDKQDWWVSRSNYLFNLTAVWPPSPGRRPCYHCGADTRGGAPLLQDNADHTAHGAEVGPAVQAENYSWLLSLIWWSGETLIFPHDIFILSCPI